MKKNKNEISNIQEDGVNISQNYLSFYKINKSDEEDKNICELLDCIDFDKELNSTKAGFKKSSSSENEKIQRVVKKISIKSRLTIRNMLQEASWCSSDPICIESKAQGYDSLNYAACHACTLLPETSCEMRNCLLDRGAVVGSILDRKRGFFGDLFD